MAGRPSSPATSRAAAFCGGVEDAAGLWGKFMGLMGRPSLPAGSALWLPESNGIHMMFMRFPIDAVFVGRPDPALAARAPSSPFASACPRGAAWCRSSAARTACWSSRG